METRDEAGMGQGEEQVSTGVKPIPAYYLKGRPVFTEEQLLQMDCDLPDEREWVDEILAHAAEREKKNS